MPAIRSDDRHFTLSVMGASILTLIIVFSLAPRKARAQMAAFAKSIVRFSVSMISPFETSDNHATISASHDKSSEYWPMGGLFEPPPSLPAESWSPSVALVRSVFGDVEGPATAPAQLTAGLPFSSPASGYSAESGWQSQQSGSFAGGGNSAGSQAGMAGGLAGGSRGVSGSGAGPGSRSEPGKSADLPSFRDADSSGGSLLTGTNPNSLGNGILDSTGAGNTLASAKTIVTGMDDPFGALPQQVDAPTLPSGSGSQGPTSGYNGWTPGGGGGTGDYPLTSGGGSSTDNPGYAGGNSGNGHKNHPSSDLPGQTQSALTDWGTAGDLGDPSPGLDEQAVPEPGTLALLVTALLGIVVLKLRSTRTA